MKAPPLADTVASHIRNAMQLLVLIEAQAGTRYMVTMDRAEYDAVVARLNAAITLAALEFDSIERGLLDRLAELKAPKKAIVASDAEWFAAKRLAARGFIDIKPAPLWDGHHAGYVFPNAETRALWVREADERAQADEHAQLADGGEGYADLLAHGGAR